MVSGAPVILQFAVPTAAPQNDALKSIDKPSAVYNGGFGGTAAC
jgi:hypothetical protein